MIAALAVAATASGEVAHAQCRLCDQAVTTDTSGSRVDDNLQLQIESDLRFDRLILSGAGAGAVTIRPNGSTGAEGIVTDVGPRAMVGTVLVHGDPGRALRVELPRRIQLHSLSGGQVTVDDVDTDIAGTPRLDAAGNLSFRFGGRLLVTGDVDGQFRGDLPITVEYL